MSLKIMRNGILSRAEIDRARAVGPWEGGNLSTTRRPDRVKLRKYAELSRDEMKGRI